MNKKVIYGFVVLVIIILLIIIYTQFRVNEDDAKIYKEESVNLDMELTSPAFSEGEQIPSKYTCDGDNINPPLEISDVPENAKNLVLIMDDPDAPAGTWVHWVVYGIPPETTQIGENTAPEKARQGRNSFGNTNYGGPCPPSGEHRYFFKLYALDTFDNTKVLRNKESIEEMMQGHILEQASLMGRYARG